MDTTAPKRSELAAYALAKSRGGPFIGPKGGKWADPKHTIHYDADMGQSGHGPGSKGRDDDRILEKVRRRPPGQGAEVTLNHHELTVILNTGRFALISAATNSKNQRHTGRTKADEATAHEALRKRLVDAGYMHTPVVGRYGENEMSGRKNEDTFLVMVHDAPSDDAQKLGQEFEQDSVIFSDHGRHKQYYTFDDIGQCSQGAGWTPKAHASDYYTQVKHPNGTFTRFGLNIDWKHRVPCGDATHAKKAIVSDMQKALDRPPAGYMAAPRSHHGGWRKKIKGEWSYWYPGKGVVGKPRKDDEEAPIKKDTRARAFGSFVKVTPGKQLPVYAESRADETVNPGLWKMENGVFAMKRVRTYEGSADNKYIRSTRNEPDVDDHTKVQLITEYGPLIRKEAREAMRLHGIRATTASGAIRGEANQTAVELQHGGVEGMLHAIAAYRGGQPFGIYAQQYVRDYVRLEAGRQGSASHLPERHVANLRRFIAARVKAQVKLQTDNPTPEQIARFFDLRLKHVHSGLAPTLRNELVPMEGYKLALGRHGTGLIGASETTMRDRDNRRSRVEWVEAFAAYLSGGQAEISDAMNEISSSFNFGSGFSTEDQIVVKDQLEHVFERMGDLRHKFTLEGRAPGRYETATTYRVDNMADLLKRRLGLGKYTEHSVAELAASVPVYRKTKDGWVEAGERLARDYMQRFVEIGMDHLRGSTDNVDDKTKHVITQAANAVAPKGRLPTGPTYADALRAHARSISQVDVEAFRAAQIKKFARGITAPGAAPREGASMHAMEAYKAVVERNAALAHSMMWMESASHEDVAMEAARQSEYGQKLSAEMRTAMTRFVDVERVSTHEGIAHMRNPSTGAHEAVRVHLGYDRYFGNPSIRGSGYTPSRVKPPRTRTGNLYWQAIGQHPNLQRLATDPDIAAGVATSVGALGPMDKSFKLVNDAILQQCERWPRTMRLLSAPDRLPTPECRAFERMVGA